MQSAKTPLLEEDEDRRRFFRAATQDGITDNEERRLDNDPASRKKTMTTTINNQTSSLLSPSIDDDENDDDPLLICVDATTTPGTGATAPSSPMSESCGSSVVGGSAAGSALTTPMEISREFPDPIEAEEISFKFDCNFQPPPALQQHHNLSSNDRRRGVPSSRDPADVLRLKNERNLNESPTSSVTEVKENVASGVKPTAATAAAAAPARDNGDLSRRSSSSPATRDSPYLSMLRRPTETATMKQSQSQMDWKLMEQQLRKAEEEEEKRRSTGRSDREAIRKKLAMEDGEPDDFYSGLFRLPSYAGGLRRSSSTSAAPNLSLQICYINDAHLDDDDDEEEEVGKVSSSSSTRAGSSACGETSALLNGAAPAAIKKPEARAAAVARFVQVCRAAGDAAVGAVDAAGVEEEAVNLLNGAGGGAENEGVDDDDFFAVEAKLQAEAKMALAQTQPMAKMQMELERMNRRKSAIADIVGLQGGYLDEKKLNIKTLFRLNLAQLQVIFNDLRTQIENHNDLLLKYLEERDDLHMEQDAKLLDIEDLTRRFREIAARSPKAPPKTVASQGIKSTPQTNKKKSKIF